MVSTGRAANRLATIDFWSRRAASRRLRRDAFISVLATATSTIRSLIIRRRSSVFIWPPAPSIVRPIPPPAAGLAGLASRQAPCDKSHPPAGAKHRASIARCGGAAPPHPGNAKSPTGVSGGALHSFKSLAVTYSCMPKGHTTIGAQRFHFRVRYGIGWFPLAIAARQTGSRRG